jgi:ubiquinone/menaquinone biosynthesis C-methylase UbiE
MIDIEADHSRLVPPDDAATGFVRFEYLRHLFAYTEAARRIPENVRLLEIGAGEGYGANHLATPTRRVVATDLSFSALMHAHVTYPRLQFYQALGTQLPFAAQSFDAVVSFQVIEHIQDEVSYVREIERVLKVGGIVCLTTPNRKLRLFPFQKPWNPYHVREYTGARLRHLIAQSFSTTQIFGVMTNAAWMRVERARVRQIALRAIRHTLFGWLRPFVPVRRQSSAINSRSPKMQSLDLPVELADFFLASDADRALDLFAVAQKLAR